MMCLSARRHCHHSPSETTAPAPSPVRDFAREALLWPDPDIRWSRRAARVALENCPFRPDWVFTTSPPESLLAAGAFLKAHTGAAWVHDFRDNWLVRPFRKQREVGWRAAGERVLARRWLSHCDAAIAVNAAIANEVRSYAPSLPVEIIEHFIHETHETIVLAADRINVVHTGSFSLSDPDTRLFDLLAAFDTAVKVQPKLHLHLVGRLSHAEHQSTLALAKMGQLTVHGVKPLEVARAFQNAADALVLVGSASAPYPPGKTTEYLATGKPIIAFGAPVWAMLFNADRAPADRLCSLQKGQSGARVDVMNEGRAIERLTEFLARCRNRMRDTDLQNADLLA
jgi:glycosyltransferase involved in cell wall biosynthesis